jgi:hypothetical protein
MMIIFLDLKINIKTKSTETAPPHNAERRERERQFD